MMMIPTHQVNDPPVLLDDRKVDTTVAVADLVVLSSDIVANKEKDLAEITSSMIGVYNCRRKNRATAPTSRNKTLVKIANH
jgi:hypothetical protein